MWESASFERLRARGSIICLSGCDKTSPLRGDYTTTHTGTPRIHCIPSSPGRLKNLRASPAFLIESQKNPVLVIGGVRLRTGIAQETPWGYMIVGWVRLAIR